MAERGLFHRILKHLRGRRDLHVPTTMVFAPLDPSTVNEERELERRGKEHGARNQPPAASTSLDDVESEIVALVGRQREIAAHDFHQNLETYAQRLSSLDLESTPTDIRIEAQKVLTDFATELSHGADAAYVARRRLVELDRHVNEFRRRGKLDQPAHYPSSLLLHYGVLLALLAVEATLNGMFLGETHVLGLLGGFTEALIIATVNVGLGAVTGYAILRQCWHRALWRKLFGFLGVVAYLAIILGFNLAVAHYRDALSAGDWDTATATALRTLTTAPLGVADIKSWLLCLIGFLFSLVALIDGLRMDDPYPGYGSRARGLEKAQKTYSRIKAGCLNDLADIKDEAIEAMAAIRKELGNTQGEYRDILEGRQRLLNTYKAHLEGLEDAANNLMAYYRHANRAARTEPAPKHFDERWQMPTPALPVFGSLDLRKIEQSVKRTNDVLEEQIGTVRTEYEKAIRTFQRIDELSEEELARGSAQAIVKAA